MIEFFLALEALDGHHILINPAAIVSISEPRVVGRLGTDKFNCVINLANGKYVATIETCASVRKRLKEKGE